MPRGTRRAGACLIPAFRVAVRLSRSNTRLAGNSKTPGRLILSVVLTMSNINPNCDGPRTADTATRRGASLSVGLGSGGNFRSVLAVLRQRELDRYGNGVPKRLAILRTGRKASWAIAEVIFDKYGEPFDAEAVIPQVRDHPLP